MRRWAFYLLIALLAFGIGLLFAGEFQRSESLYQSEMLYQVESKVLPIKGKTEIARVILPAIEDTEPQEICSGIDNEDFFEPAINRWLKGKKLSTKPMRPPKEYRSDGDEYTASLIDVNHDGKKELLIKAYCSPIKNCSFFIYEKQGTESRQLFFSEHPIQAMSFEKTSSKHYQDIRVETKLNNKSGFYSTYKFEQGKFKGIYDTTECAKYEVDENNRESTTPIECYMVEDVEE